MTENKNYQKIYKLVSTNNLYFISFESINEKKLYIQLTHRTNNGDLIFYTEKLFDDIKNENKNLSEINSMKELINYFAKLTKLDKIGINKDNNLIYIITFINEDSYIKFQMVRKIGKDLENEILKMYNTIKYREEENEKQSEKNKNLGTSTGIKLHEKSINISNPNNINVINIDNNLSTNINIFNNNSINNISINNNNIVNISKSNNEIDENIYKENNNTIIYKKDPWKCKEKKILYKKNTCDIFTAFQLQNGHPIIAWTSTSNKKEINIQNLDNKLMNKKKAHNQNIEDLKYYYDSNILENYIISLASNDEEELKIWNLKNEYELEIKSIINQENLKMKIEQFCFFNNKYYSTNISYLFIYGENGHLINKKNNYSKSIICYKLNNNKEIINLEKNEKIKINNFDTIYFLDTFYYLKKGKLYLINCNNKNVNVIENPLQQYKKIFFCDDNKENLHLSAFINENNNVVKLFDSNYKGIYIWNISDINNPILESKLFINDSFPYDICLWNYNYLCVSTSDGFMIIQINQNKIIIHLEKKENIKTHSKIRKLYLNEEGYSLIGKDNEDYPSLWSIIR